jgi:hypothetical protein
VRRFYFTLPDMRPTGKTSPQNYCEFLKTRSAVSEQIAHPRTKTVFEIWKNQKTRSAKKKDQSRREIPPYGGVFPRRTWVGQAKNKTENKK